jgi:hypothetical protein
MQGIYKVSDKSSLGGPVTTGVRWSMQAGILELIMSASKHIGDGWVTRCIERKKDHLISKWTKGMDAVRHHADSEAKYDQYGDLLHGKITQYEVEPAHTYNMDEKGFAIGVIGKQKRIFSKRAFKAGEVTHLLQDGSHEWITVLAGVCADGSTLPPGLVYQSKNCTLRNN